MFFIAERGFSSNEEKKSSHMQRHELDVREVLGKVIPGEEADDGVAEGLVSEVVR